MSPQRLPDGHHDEGVDDPLAPAHFLGVLALVVMAAAILFVAFVLIVAVTHQH